MIAVLDTHAVIWALQDDPRLGKRAKALIASAKPRELAIADTTLLEIAMLARKGSIQLTTSVRALLENVEQRFHVCPINATIAADAMTLELSHGDPFDRTIVATARALGAKLISKDRRIVESGCIETVW